MSVTSVQEHFSNTVGNIASGRHAHTAVWLVKTSSPLDGPNTVVGDTRLPLIGTVYSFGGDTDPVAFLRELTAVRSSESRTMWFVTGRYETPGFRRSSQARINEDGQETDAPQDEFRRISLRSTKLVVPVERGTLLSNGFPNRAKFSEGPITNSAGIVFNPPVTKEIPIKVITLTDNRDDWPADLASREGKINSDITDIERKGYREFFGPGELLCDSVSGALQFEDGKFFWSVEIVLLFNPDGWDVEVLDRGFLENPEAGQPDGDGGVVEEGDILNGTAALRVGADIFGQPHSEPVQLDGQGNRLPRGDQPVYLEYRIYEAEQFQPLVR